MSNVMERVIGIYNVNREGDTVMLNLVTHVHDINSSSCMNDGKITAILIDIDVSLAELLRDALSEVIARKA